ncbi:hypothetical protein HK104_011417 [Borealophlyctis nickersoniae]|nr:hypothetical protein HK104_011417 [Borealophlyctis nickersoniae]
MRPLTNLSRCIRSPSALRAVAPRLLAPAATQVRTFYKFRDIAPKQWTKTAIDETVYDYLLTYANIPRNEVVLESNIERDLKVSDRMRVGLFMDILTEFEMEDIYTRMHRPRREPISGREMADWVAAQLEERDRFIY